MSTDIARHRQSFARLVARRGGVVDPRICAAFAHVPRDKFLGPGPWCISEAGDMSPSSNPRYVYRDIVIALDPSKGITNGRPSLHASCIAAVTPMPGESVVHVGAGTGYYTAMLAELVGSEGRVTALELDPELATKARHNLVAWPNVAVHIADATRHTLQGSDVIYVSAGVSSLPLHWLDALRPGGRLLFPLMPGDGEGAMLCVTRGATDYAAKFGARARFYPCFGAHESVPQLAAAFARNDLSTVRALKREEPIDATCWYSATGWWLSTVRADH